MGKIISHCEEIINITLSLGINQFECPHFLTSDWLLNITISERYDEFQ